MVKQMVDSSPIYRLFGMRIESFHEDGATLVLEADEKLTNLYGTLHGGALAVLVDSASGVSLATRLDPSELAVTVDLNVTYLIPARPGRLSGRGRVIYRGRTVGVTEVSVTDEEGKLLVHGKGIHAIQKR